MTEPTNITKIETYDSMIKIINQKNQLQQERNRIDQKITEAHQAWKQKKRDLEKAIASDKSSFKETEELEAEAKELKVKIPPLEEEKQNLIDRQQKIMQRFNEVSERFIQDAISAVNELITQLHSHLDDAQELAEAIHASARAAESTPVNNVPYIHPALESIEDAKRHLNQASQKWNNWSKKQESESKIPA